MYAEGVETLPFGTGKGRRLIINDFDYMLFDSYDDIGRLAWEAGKERIWIYCEGKRQDEPKEDKVEEVVEEVEEEKAEKK